MKKRLALVVAIVLVFAQLFGCGSKGSLELNKKDVTIGLFEETEIVATVTDIEGKISWTNSNDKIIKMTPSGNKVKIEAISSGNAKITAKIGDVVKECNVVVSETSDKLVLSTNLNGDVLLKAGMTKQLTSQVKFKNKEFNKATVTYVSENSDIASVSKEGLITAGSPGNAKITAKASYFNNVSNEIVINVIVKNEVTFDVGKEQVDIYVFEEGSQFPGTYEIIAKIHDGETVVDGVEYTVEIENEEIISIENGIIKGLQAGRSDIMFSCVYDGETYNKNISVSVLIVPVITMNVTPDGATIYAVSPTENYASTVKATAEIAVDEVGVETPEITWSVIEGTDIISIDNNGLVTAKAVGKGTIEATYNYNGIINKKTATVNVADPLIFGTHANFNHEGVVATIKKGAQLTYKNVSIPNDKDVPFIVIQKIPSVALHNEYTDADTAAKEGDKVSMRELQIFFITISDASNPEKHFTIGISPDRNPSDFYDNITYSRFGVRADNWPEYANGSYDFLGWCPASNKDVYYYANMGRDGGYAKSAEFSFYGFYNQEETDKYAVGFSMVGTTVYIHHNGLVEQLWDLNADSAEYSRQWASYYDPPVWDGFSSDKVNISITGDYYELYDKVFNLSILSIGGEKTTAESLDNFAITAR